MIWLLAFFLFAEPSLAERPSLSAPLLLDGESLGETWVYLGRETSLGAAGLKIALAPLLTAAARMELDSILKGREAISLRELETLGITARFEEKTLVTTLVIPRHLRVSRHLSVRPSASSTRETLNPAAFSGYLNSTASQAFNYPQSKSRAPFRGNLGLVTNLHGLVLETGSTYSEGTEHEWTREDTRLTKDFEEEMLRLSVGDVPILSQGYQNSKTLGGVSVSRQYSIQPYLNIRPLNRTELLVKRPSTIEVYVNDGFVNRMSVNPGPVELSDFPLFSGINKVDLKVTDDAGGVQWINLNMLYDNQLLGSGIQQFSYTFGAPATPFRNDRRYDDRNLTGSFFHRVGLSDRFNVGTSFQADRSSWLVGQDNALLTRGGLISSEGGYSRQNGGRDGFAGRLRFRSLDYKLGADKPFRGAAEVEYKARHFAAIGQTNAVNDFSWKYELSLSRPISAVASASASLQYLVNRLNNPDRKSARFDFTSEIAPSWRSSFSYTIEREKKIGHQFQAVLTWIESSGQLYGNLSYDYPTKTVRLEANRSPSSYVGDVRANLGAQNSPDNARGDALLEYTHEKANLRFEQLSTYRREAGGGRRTDHTSTLTAATAIAWAGGAVAWTRPIQDSFVILSAQKEYRDYPIPVNRVEDSAEATVNRYGNGALPNLSAYNETPVVLDPTFLPIGFSLEREYLIARPTYRSGIRVDLGSPAHAIVTGQLRKPNGEPLRLAVGEVRLGPKIAATFFTNREGVFLLENLPPGNYELVTDQGDFAPYPFHLKENQGGIVRLGPLSLKGSP